VPGQVNIQRGHGHLSVFGNDGNESRVLAYKACPRIRYTISMF
jgi:hypothetical protein